LALPTADLVLPSIYSLNIDQWLNRELKENFADLVWAKFFRDFIFGL